MKRKALLIALVVVASTLLGATVAVAGRGGNMTKVLNSWSGHGYYMASGKSGVIHEWYYCDSDWYNCPGRWVYYEIEKHPEPPTCDPGGYEDYINLWDVGDGSDILHPGEYWVCMYPFGLEVFRAH